MTPRKKLIEVALPLEAINAACKADKDRKTGHIRNIHKWFAPMPLPALRALIFASVVDAPESEDDLEVLLGEVADLVESGPVPPPATILASARNRVRESLRGTDLRILDPFCGGGSTLVEAQRLGLPAEGSDLNPIPVLIATSLTSIPPRHRGTRSLTNPALVASPESLDGFLEDVRHYAHRIRSRVLDETGAMYPTAPNGDRVIYWWWAHAVPSPDPAFRGCLTPLTTTWWLSRRSGEQCHLVPHADASNRTMRFSIANSGEAAEASKSRCLFSDSPISYEYVREQAQRGHLHHMLLAYASDGQAGRKYWIPDEMSANAADVAAPTDLPELDIPENGLGVSVGNYSVKAWSQLFTPRQQLMLRAFSAAIADLPRAIKADGGSEDYAKDVTTVIGLCFGKLVQASSTIVRLNVRKGPSPKAEPAFARGDIQLNWDFAETNPFGGSVGDWNQVVTTSLRAYGLVDSTGPAAAVYQADARGAGERHPGHYLIVSDPPYFAAIGYADLSEYFYYWLRMALRDVHPQLLSTLGVPKTTELIASPGRHGGRHAAAKYFVDGFTETFRRLAQVGSPQHPMVIVYAQQQKEQKASGVATTGWEAMLEAIIAADLSITGTWPIWGTGSARMRAHGSNSLASYIVMVCRPAAADRAAASRREFVATLRAELPQAIRHLQKGSVAPVDFAQAAIGPGMSVFTRYARVVDAEGQSLRVRDALSIINSALDEVLAEQEGDFDADSRWALAWFEQNGFGEGDYGVAETLSKAKNTSVDGLRQAGILASARGKVRLLKPSELPDSWDPLTDTRLTTWEMVHHLIRAYESDGEAGAAALVAKLGGNAETARELCYRLYALSERKSRTAEATAYNALVQSWPEIVRLARGQKRSAPVADTGLFTDDDEE